MRKQSQNPLCPECGQKMDEIEFRVGVAYAEDEVVEERWEKGFECTFCDSTFAEWELEELHDLADDYPNNLMFT